MSRAPDLSRAHNPLYRTKRKIGYKHLHRIDDDGYLTRTVPSDVGRRYKELVNDECCKELKSLEKYDPDVFRKLIRLNLRKANLILCGRAEMPDKVRYGEWSGTEILERQLESAESKGVLQVLNTSLFIPVDFSPSRFLGE